MITIEKCGTGYAVIYPVGQWAMLRSVGDTVEEALRFMRDTLESRMRETEHELANMAAALSEITDELSRKGKAIEEIDDRLDALAGSQADPGEP